MSDGPRPPAQVARPVLPPSFLERVRAAAEAEQRLEQRAQEETRQPAEPEPPAARPAEPRRPPRFVRSRDWRARGGDKTERAQGDQPEPGPQRGIAGEQLSPAREGVAGGGNHAAEPGPPAALPRRVAGAGPRPGLAAQARPDTAAAPAPMATDELTEPIPVIRMSPAGEPLPPAGMGSGIPATDGTVAATAAQEPSPPPAQATTDQAAAAQAQAAPPLSKQARTDQAPAGQARTRQAPAGPPGQACCRRQEGRRQESRRRAAGGTVGGPPGGGRAGGAQPDGCRPAGRRSGNRRAGHRPGGCRPPGPAGRGPPRGGRGRGPAGRQAAGQEVSPRPEPPPGRPGRRPCPRHRRGNSRPRIRRAPPPS